MECAFEKLEVYQRAVDFAEEVSRLTSGFPREIRYLFEPLNRHSLAIALSLAEAGDCPRPAESRRHWFSAKSSIQACLPALELCLRKGLLDQDRHRALTARARSLAAMVANLMPDPPEDGPMAFPAVRAA